MEKIMNAAQHKLVMTMFSKLGLIHQKENIVAGFSNGKTTSTRALDHNASIELIRWLKSQDKEEQAAEKQRRKIIAIARTMGWEKIVVQPDGSIKKKADMERIDNWCLKFGYLHKKLNHYKLYELPTLVTQFEAVEKSFLKSNALGG
jgi:hypothetical protein